MDHRAEYVLRDTDEFRRLLADRGHTQASLARSVQLSRQFIYCLMTGSRRASAFTAYDIAMELGVGVGRLFDKTRRKANTAA